MKKTVLLICIAGLVVTSAFFAASSHSVQAELTSKQIGEIEKALEKLEDRAKGVQRTGYMKLKKLGPTTAPFVADALKDKTVNPASRKLMSDLLGELKQREATHTLIYTLKDPVSPVRAASCKALGMIADPAAVKPLLGMLNDPEPNVRESAVYALISFDDNLIPPKVAELMNDNSDNVRVVAATLLSIKADPRTAEVVREAMQKDLSATVRGLSARALGNMKNTRAVNILMEAVVEDGSEFTREESAIALGKIGEKRAVPQLIEALKDEYKDVQLRAMYSLRKLTGKNFDRNYNEWSDWYRRESYVKRGETE